VNRGLPPLRFAPRLRGSHQETHGAVAIGSPVRVARGVRRLQNAACSNKRIGRECPAPPVTTAICGSQRFPGLSRGPRRRAGRQRRDGKGSGRWRDTEEIQKIALIFSPRSMHDPTKRFCGRQKPTKRATRPTCQCKARSGAVQHTGCEGFCHASEPRYAKGACGAVSGCPPA
jgi:hypothetical protein